MVNRISFFVRSIRKNDVVHFVVGMYLCIAYVAIVGQVNGVRRMCVVGRAVPTRNKNCLLRSEQSSNSVNVF